MLKISNVKVPIQTKEEDYPKIVSSHLNIRAKELKNVKLLKRSIDARKNDVHYISSFIFEHTNEENLLKKNRSLSIYKPFKLTIPFGIQEKTIVVGSGPAGLFCAWLLAKSGSPVTLLERGKQVEERIKDVESFFANGKLNIHSNIQFGEGGAGTFSDGKLTTGIKDPKVTTVLETFVKYGAPRDILYEAMPHIGTDYLRQVVKNMREDLIAMGVEVRFEALVTDILMEQDCAKGVEINHQEKLYAKHIVLAIGHSARDTFEMLYQRAVPMASKPFAVGLRIEHLQQEVNAVQYKKVSRYLKAAPYKLAYHATNGRGVYTFCMCPGGEVVGASSEEGLLVTNGMSEYARDKANANAAVLVSVDQKDFGSEHPLAGMYYQRELEKKAFELGGGHYQAPISLLKDYMENATSIAFGHITASYRPNVKFANLNALFSDEINQAMKEGLLAFGKKLSFFQDDQAVLTGVESRSSSPVRFVRDEKCMSPILNLYPCGEGAGQAGGIVSAAVDGLKVALAILQ